MRARCHGDNTEEDIYTHASKPSRMDSPSGSVSKMNMKS